MRIRPHVGPHLENLDKAGRLHICGASMHDRIVSKSQQGQSSHILQTGDRIVITGLDPELNDRRGTIVGPQDLENECFSVCLEHTNGNDGAIVHLSPWHIRKVEIINHVKISDEEALATPVYCQESEAADGSVQRFAI